MQGHQNVLATEETAAVTQQVSHRQTYQMPIPLVVTKRYEGQRVTVMVTAHYSNQQGSKSRQNPCQVQPTENIGNFSVSRRCLWVYELQFQLSGEPPVFQNLNYKLQRRLSDVLPNQQSHRK